MKRLHDVLSRVLGINAAAITDETSPENVATWDSFNGLLLVSELEKTFSITFTMDEVTAVKRVADIKAALQRHGVKLEEHNG
jgi:acyl carrier protein